MCRRWRREIEGKGVKKKIRAKMLSFKFGSLFVFLLQNVKTCQFIDFMLWEAGCCCKEIAPKIGGKNVKKKRTAERERERLSPSLERRRALDFLFAAICLVLLREINSPRHTDQYSLNPHLIWQEFPPISPSPAASSSSPRSTFYFPSPLVFNHFSRSRSEHVT